MAVAKQTISRRWCEQNAAKLWPYVTTYNMAREMRTLANTGISFEDTIWNVNRIVFNRLIRPHPGTRLSTALSTSDFVAVVKDPDRKEVIAEEAQRHGYGFDSNGFLFSLPNSDSISVKREKADDSMAAIPPALAESTGRTIPMLTKESGTRGTISDVPVKSEEHDERLSAPTSIASQKRGFRSTFGPESLKPMDIEDLGMLAPDTKIPSENHQSIPDISRGQTDTNGTSTAECAGESTDSGDHGRDRRESYQEDEEDNRDLEMHLNILSRMVAQGVDWRGAVMRCQLRFVFGNDRDMRDAFIRAWEERAREAARSILREFFPTY